MAWCDEEIGHIWGAEQAGGLIPAGTLCSCWSRQPDGSLGHTPIPRDALPAEGEWWITERELYE